MSTPSLALFPARTAAAPSVVAGIGCRAGVGAEAIDAALRAALAALPGPTLATPATSPTIARVATLDAKADEPGLRACCARHGWPLVGFSCDAIAALGAQVSNDPMRSPSAPSRAARERFGVDGVCEPCALLACPGGVLVVRKLRMAGVTVALAALPTDFSPTGLDR